LEQPIKRSDGSYVYCKPGVSAEEALETQRKIEAIIAEAARGMKAATENHRKNLPSLESKNTD
jgi:hypothetical protein